MHYHRFSCHAFLSFDGCFVLVFILKSASHFHCHIYRFLVRLAFSWILFCKSPNGPGVVGSQVSIILVFAWYVFRIYASIVFEVDGASRVKLELALNGLLIIA
jgi:hypothetical protein